MKFLAVIGFNSNVSSLRIQNALGRSADSLRAASERLSSGQRINRPSDDAAGLAISSRLGSDSRVYAQGMRNISDGISAINLASSSLDQLSGVTMRLRELAVQASNGSFSSTQRISLHNEARQLTDEFNRLIATTKFNKRALLDLSDTSFRIQGGYGTDGGISFNLGTELSRTVGSGSFSYASSFGGSTGGSGIETADFDGDGKIDILSSGLLSGAEINWGNGQGGSAATTVLAGGVSGGQGVSIGDVNGDGRPDIVTMDYSTTASARVFINQGNRNFSSVTMAVGDTDNLYGGVKFGDVNGDGKLDILAYATTDSKMAVFLGNGNGTFNARTSYTVSVGTSGEMAVGDINGDGRDDVVIDTGYMLGQADGSLSSLISHDGVGEYLALADFNLDGKLDLAGFGTNGMVIRLGNGDGTFGAAATYPAGNTYSAGVGGLKAVDLNGDGFLDLIGAGYEGSARVFFGNGTGSFTQVTSFATAVTTNAIGIGDLNGDGVPDIITGSDSSAGVRAYLANTAQTTSTQQFNLTTQADARNSMSLIDDILERIGLEQGALGSAQSRLQTALKHLSATRENYVAANSRIIDADIASESAHLVRAQILQQVGSSVLAQANQSPSLALDLLRNL